MQPYKWLMILVVTGTVMGFYQLSSGLAAEMLVISVNSTADVVSNDGVCTLREAITAANRNLPSGTMAGECPAGSGADTIVFDVTTPATITLTILYYPDNDNIGGDLDILSSLTIDGGTPGTITINGNRLDRVLDVRTGTVELRGLTIQNGAIDDVSFPFQLTNSSGGGIRNAGTLTLYRTRVLNNRASHGYPGTTQGRDGGYGGGIYSIGANARLHLIESEIRNNQAGNGGIPIDCEPPNCERTGYGGQGGGIYANGIVTITDSIIAENHAGAGGLPPDGTDAYPANGGNGGGIALEQASAVIQATSIFQNVAGASQLNGETDGLGAAGDGGGIAVGITSTLTIESSAVYGNRAGVRNGWQTGIGGRNGYGGGIAAYGSVTLERSTISGNGTQSSGTNGMGFGGGLYSAGVIAVRHSTIANNEAKGLFSAGGGLYGEGMTLFNTIVGDNQAPMGADCYGTMVSEGYNLLETTGAVCVMSGMTATHIYADPQLDPLALNGGTTLNHALPGDSPALDAGNCGTSSADQRGLPRPVDLSLPNVADGCDIGAYEAQADIATPTPTPTIVPPTGTATSVPSTPTPTSTSVPMTPTATATLPSESGYEIYLPLVQRGDTR